MERSAQIRRRIGALGPRGRGGRIPGTLRRDITAYARERRRAGASLDVLARETGVSPETVRRWLGEARATRELVPVEVVADAIEGNGLVVVSPRGYRIEGLDIAGTV